MIRNAYLTGFASSHLPNFVAAVATTTESTESSHPNSHRYRRMSISNTLFYFLRLADDINESLCDNVSGRRTPVIDDMIGSYGYFVHLINYYYFIYTKQVITIQPH